MTNGNGTQTHERMAPHSVEAEEALCGGIMLNPDAYAEAAAIVTPEMFFIERNRWVWESIRRIVDRGEEVDNITVTQDIEARGLLDQIGGASYITYLINHTPASIYTDTYASIVERAAIRRGYIAAASTMARAAWREAENIDDVIDECESVTLAVAQNRHKGGLSTAPSVMRAVYEKVERARLTGVSGQETGLTDLDRILGGLQDTDLIIVASRPGVGKTSLGLTITFNRCERGGRPLILSKEMGQEQLGERMISMATGISTHKMRTGNLSDSEWDEFVIANDKISEFKFVVDDSSNMPLSSLLSMARRAKKDHNIDLMIVDYLQLIRGTGENRHQEVGSVSRALKALARELKIPVLAMAQLNRQVENRQDKRPLLSDLAESGAIEQDADVIMFIYRDELYNENTERPNQADIIIAKHRNGPTGTAPLYFRKELTQFSNLAKTDVDYSQY